jgi:hypothetical protein
MHARVFVRGYRRASVALVTGVLAALARASLDAGPSLAQVPPLPEAGGFLQLSWDQCAPLVLNKNSAAGPNVLYASVQGHATEHQAYQVWLLLGDANHQLPDAWRFDAAGCNGGFFSFSAQPPVALAKTCPGFVPAVTQQFTIPVFQLAPPGLGYLTTLGNAFLAVSYPSGSSNADPGTRYHLVGFTFDHTFSTAGPTPGDLSSCGSFERGMCIFAVPYKCSWLDLAGNEFAFRGVGGTQTTQVVYNGGTPDPNCPGAIPARPSTWGSIKAQYKR